MPSPHLLAPVPRQLTGRRDAWYWLGARWFLAHHGSRPAMRKPSRAGNRAGKEPHCSGGQGGAIDRNRPHGTPQAPVTPQDYFIELELEELLFPLLLPLKAPRLLFPLKFPPFLLPL